jgi:zinc/manganese transport system substrate-binding protein
MALGFVACFVPPAPELLSEGSPATEAPARTPAVRKKTRNDRRRLQTLLAALLAFAPLPATAALNIFACEPEWGALATELGGDKVSVFVATTGRQDPHQIQARPSLIAKARSADLVLCTGAELEIGWMPVVLRQAANGKVQPGTAGYFAAADNVRLLEVPARLDRAEGDIHAAGNPHIQTSPVNIRAVAAALGPRLAQLDVAQGAYYTERTQSFLKRWDEALQQWQAKATPLRGMNFAAYHKGWAYLADWLGMREIATIEPKPGVPPGGAYIAQLIDELPKRSVGLIVYAAYEDPRASESVAQRTSIPAVMLPSTVGGTDAAATLFGLYDDIVTRLLASRGSKSG